MRTPLTVVQGNIEAMLDGVHEVDEAHLGAILEETRVLGRLVDDLRTVALSESGSLPLHREPTDLAVVATDAVAAFRSSAQAAGVELRLEIADDIPLLEVDPVRIKEVISNLVANALRHTPAGGSIALDARVGDGGADGSPREVVVTVQDTGSGIEPDLLPHVFDRFAKAAGLTRLGAGTGDRARPRRGPWRLDRRREHPRSRLDVPVQDPGQPRGRLASRPRDAADIARPGSANATTAAAASPRIVTRMVASNPADAMIGEAPMLPSTSAAASAAEIIAKALPRSASVLRREISTRRGVRTNPAPPPVRAPASIRTGVAGGSTSRPIARPVAKQSRQDEQARLDPIGQPARWDAECQHGDPVGDEEQSDVGARQLRALRQVGRHDAPMGHVQERDDERRRPLPAEREAEPSRGERGAGRGRLRSRARASARAGAREILAMPVLDRRSQPHRTDDEHQDPDDDHPHDEDRDGIERGALAEDRERERRHRDERQVVGAAHEREPKAPSVGRHESRNQRQRRRQRQRDTDPLADPGDDERQPVATGFDAGQEQHAGTDEVRDGADAKEAQPAEAVDQRTTREGRRDLDERRKPDDHPDLLVGHPGPGKGDRKRSGEAVESGLEGEQRDGESGEHRAIFAQSAAG